MTILLGLCYRTFTASFENNDSRTYVEDGLYSRWTEGDRVSLFDWWLF